MQTFLIISTALFWLCMFSSAIVVIIALTTRNAPDGTTYENELKSLHNRSDEPTEAQLTLSKYLDGLKDAASMELIDPNDFKTVDDD